MVRCMLYNNYLDKECTCIQEDRLRYFFEVDGFN